MKKEQFRALVEKYLSGLATDEEIQSLLNYYHSFEQEASDYPETDTKELLQRARALMRQNELSKTAPIPIKWLAAASILLVLSFMGWWTYQQYFLKETQEIFATAKGEQRAITLSDGTEIRLNASSQIRYSKDFNGEKREITLIGEAYFNVSKDPERPFIIHTADMDIEVLGTEFNVKAYAEDETTETALISGSVAIHQRSNPQEEIILKPMEKFVLHRQVLAENHDGRVGEKPVESAKKIETNILPLNLGKNDETQTIAETGWLQGRMAFRDERFSSIARTLERYYDIEISFEKPVTANYRYTSTFEDEDLDNLLQSLQEAEYFKYRKEGKKIIIY